MSTRTFLMQRPLDLEDQEPGTRSDSHAGGKLLGVGVLLDKTVKASAYNTNEGAVQPSSTRLLQLLPRHFEPQVDLLGRGLRKSLTKGRRAQGCGNSKDEQVFHTPKSTK